MNSKNRKLAVISIAIALLAALPFVRLSAQVTETKNIKKSFAINKSSIVDIGNKYGDISIETWDKDSVRVEIQLRVTDKSRDKLRAKMNSINFDLTQSGHYIVANTLIGENKSMITSEFNRIKETVGFADATVQINMNVKIPDNLELRINNKFGNVYIDDYNGKTSINMSNGKLKAHNLGGNSNLKISFGDAIINKIENGTYEIYYSELNLSSAKNLVITSKTSDITITEVGRLQVSSSRDDYRIRMISNLETDASWTDFSITEFNSKSSIKMNFGDLTIEKIKNSFESISINARSTKINLSFDQSTDINFDITSNREISLPLDAKIDNTEKINEKEKIMRYKGRTGSNVQISKPKLVLNSSSGEIKIQKY